MTQERSRMLGRALIALAGLQSLLFLRGLPRRPALASIALAVLGAPVAALLAWVGYTLATMEWDAPADYPPEP